MIQKATKLGGLTTCHCPAPSNKQNEYTRILEVFSKNVIMTPNGTFIHKYIH